MNINKLISMVTKNTAFVFGYILSFSIVVIITLLTWENMFWLILTWVMLSILGVFVTLGAYVSYIEASQSIRWPTVSAKLLSSRVSSGIGTGNKHTYRPIVEYEFSYLGKQYKGNTIDYSGRSGSKSWAKKVITDLQQKGIALRVSVNPDDPQMNVLKPGIRLVHYLRYIIGPAMIVTGIMGVMGRISLN